MTEDLKGDDGFFSLALTRKDEILDAANNLNHTGQAFECLLRTKSDLLKAHQVVVDSGVLLFYRKSRTFTAGQVDTNVVGAEDGAGAAALGLPPRIRIELDKCHLRVSMNRHASDDTSLETVLFALQADLDEGRKIVMYFESVTNQKSILAFLLAQQGFSNQLDQYKICGQLGSSNYSRILLVKHKKTGFKYAMKIIKASTFDRNSVQHMNEIELLARCKSSPNIVHYKEYFVANRQHCLVMEHMPGGDLYQQMKLREFEPLTESMIRHILLQICSALKYLHTRQIVHRDIKLENVMLSEDGSGCTAKLADFGLSEQLVSSYSTRRTKVGTQGYMAPEILEGKPYGTASDIWSLGCLLHVLLAQQFPDATKVGAKLAAIELKQMKASLQL